LNFEDEPYVRLYTRKTLTWKLLGWEGRVVRNAMLDGEFDAAGIFEFRGDAAAAISAVTDLPIEIVRVGLQRLIDTETWIVTARSITWQTYEEAQNCRRSDRLRQRESRRARSALAVTDVTPQRDASHSLSQPVTDRHPPSLPLPPSAPIPPPTHGRDPDAHAPEGPPPGPPPDVPGLERVAGGVARTYTMPSKDPPKAYLDVALMGGVRPEQARSTWKHYWGAGLPAGGVERLHDWLTQRAAERAAQTASLPRARPRDSPGAELDTTGAATAFRLDEEHRDFGRRCRKDVDWAAGEYRRGSTCATLDTLQQSRDFMNRLKCWEATGTFHAEGPLPRPARAPKEARA
jgi:hypothetical protein